MHWAKIASLLMCLGVALGAFGSHALRGKVSDYHMDVYKTAVLYHMLHALGLFAIAWLMVQFNNPKINLAGIFLTAGIFLFSGSLYLFAVTHLRWLGFVTPWGGVCFLTGWLLLFLIISETIKVS
jgi:uncharacterized membrane protein YgdD (TMEM256/DUF423 family)